MEPCDTLKKVSDANEGMIVAMKPSMQQCIMNHDFIILAHVWGIPRGGRCKEQLGTWFENVGTSDNGGTSNPRFQSMHVQCFVSLLSSIERDSDVRYPRE